ncbi:MAG: hypothetical protein C5B51_13075 [Terriglobia bacterium]|nr:MAG: hypothetical protein C5B51_13075 [Terriglobia bacterium]
MTGATISPEQVLKELDARWAELGKEGPGVLRACSMSLLAVCDESDHYASALETIALLMPSHPARAIMIRLRRGESLAAHAAAQCWMPFGQRQQVCSEQIEITAAPESLEEVASLVEPIVAPDLPVILWCRSPRLIQSTGFAHLIGCATKLILDSAAWAEAKASIRQIAAMAARGRSVADLSWVRLTCWREVLSQVFENREHAARLSDISRIHVKYGAGAEAAALYMGAWLVDALDAVHARTDLHIEADSGAPAAQIASVELSGAEFQASFTHQAGRLVTNVGAVSHCAGLPPSSDYALLREELGVRADPVFERTLASAARL